MQTTQCSAEEILLNRIILKKTPNKGVRRNTPFSRKIAAQKYLLALVLPNVVWFLIFCYIPMFGILTAFKDYSLAKGVIGSPWAGLKYFQQFVTSIFFPTVVKNTVCIGLLKVLFAFPAPIVLALLLNELRSNKLKHVIQTASYLPYFVSWAIVLGIWFRLLSVDGGLVNNLLVGLKLTDKPINFTQTPQYMWPFAVFTEVWKNIGFNSIIYVAALSRSTRSCTRPPGSTAQAGSGSCFTSRCLKSAPRSRYCSSLRWVPSSAARGECRIPTLSRC
jgi:ABC-type polysaccharide transport system permease subunit